MFIEYPFSAILKIMLIFSLNLLKILTNPSYSVERSWFSPKSSWPVYKTAFYFHCQNKQTTELFSRVQYHLIGCYLKFILFTVKDLIKPGFKVTYLSFTISYPKFKQWGAVSTLWNGTPHQAMHFISSPLGTNEYHKS